MTNWLKESLQAGVAWLHQRICVPWGIGPHLPPDSARVATDSPISANDPGEICLPIFGQHASTDSSWLNLAEECVSLFDEVERNKPFFAPPGQELAEHVLCRIQEMLQRSGVAAIADEAIFDRHRHQPVNRNPGATEQARIIETISPGFAIGQRILRRARVKLAENLPAAPLIVKQGIDHEQ